ncbi:MAG: VTT domain-containing protein [Kofleriaceae bacterium]
MDDALAIFVLCATTMGAGALSGLFPIFNSELYLVGVVAAAGANIPFALVIALSLALGQVGSKVVLYYAARRGARLGRGRFAEKLEKARVRAAKWKSKPYSIAFLAASVGIPPFYLTALVAGVLELDVRRFFAISMVGRIIRFGTIAIIVVLA